MVLDESYKSSKYLISKGEQTKRLLSIQGRLFLECEISSLKNGKVFTTSELGEASGNIKRNWDSVLRGAISNAQISHISKGGKSSPSVFILDYWIIYFDTNISFKRVYYKPRGSSKKGSYRNITRVNGKIVSNDEWSPKRDLFKGYKLED